MSHRKNLRRRPGDIDVFVERGYVVIMQDPRYPSHILLPLIPR